MSEPKGYYGDTEGVYMAVRVAKDPWNWVNDAVHLLARVIEVYEDHPDRYPADYIIPHTGGLMLSEVKEAHKLLNAIAENDYYGRR